MSDEELKVHIENRAPAAEFIEGGQFLQVVLPSADCRKLLEDLKDSDSTLFDYLFCLTGIDYPEHLEVIYHLRSTTLGHSVVVKARIDSREKPEIKTVSDLWRTAEFHEREAYDFYGIVFTDHPDLRRIFLEDDWVGWPMRKDYEDPINMIEY